MPELSAHHAAIRHDIELALLTDPTPAGWVYVNLEGIDPRIIAHCDALPGHLNRSPICPASTTKPSSRRDEQDLSPHTLRAKAFLRPTLNT